MPAAKISPADIARLGPDAASIKSQTDPARWKALVHYAHSRGYAVGGVLSGVPDALKPRLRSSLVSEAKRTVGDAYAPVEKTLSDEQNRISAIADRRRTDEAAFNRWAQTQRDALMVSAKSADDALAARKGDILAAANATMAGQQQATQQEASQQPGRVSDPSQSKLLDQSAVQARQRGILTAADLASTVGASSSDRAAASISAAQGFQKMADSGREADSQKQLSDVLGARRDLAGKRAQDYLTALQALKDKETDKASANADRLVAADKLGVQRDQLANDILQQNRTFGLQTKKFNLDTWVAQHQNSVDAAKVQLGYDQIASRDGKAAADRKLKKYLGDQAHRDRVASRAAGDTGSPADRKNSTNQASTVATIIPIIKDLHAKKVPGSRIRKHVMDRTQNGVSDIQIDVAEDLRHNNGTLSPRGRRKAKALGISTATMKNLGWI